MWLQSEISGMVHEDLSMIIAAVDKITMKALSSGEMGSGCQDRGGEVNIK
jgi:hypothetical protein